jgi:hypothetical protein
VTKQLFAALALAAAARAAGCGGAQEEIAKKPKAAKVDEPFFRVQSIGPLAAAQTGQRLPFLLGADGAAIDTPCFERATGLEPWATERQMVLDKLAENQVAVSKAIAAWVDAEILSSGPLVELEGKLQATFADPVITSAPDSKVRFAADQRCVDAKRRALPDGARAVTTLFGAETLVLRGRGELSKQQLKALRKAAQKAKVGFRPARGFPRAVDPATGAFAVSESGAPLFEGLGGTPVTEVELPPPGERPLGGFDLVLYRPLWFAWGDLPKERWGREVDPATCAVNVVDWDATPRVPACDEMREAGYGVEPGETDGEVVIKVASDGVVATKTAKYGEEAMIQAGGRVVAWVTATAIEEGADLKIDSLVLVPKEKPAGELGAFGTPAPDKKKKKKH